VIIAFDSASTDLSVALAAPDGGLVADDAWRSDTRQGHDLLPRLLVLLERGGVAWEQVGATAVGIGPGSFTGLRVGMGLAKGLALALGRPIVGVPSLDAWLDADPLARAAVARAGAREAYVLFRGEPEPHVVDRDLLPPEMATDRVVAPAELAAALGLGGAVSPVGGAAAIARRAAQRLATDPAGDDLARLEPAYLRAPRGLHQISDAEIVRWP